MGVGNFFTDRVKTKKNTFPPIEWMQKIKTHISTDRADEKKMKHKEYQTIKSGVKRPLRNQKTHFHRSSGSEKLNHVATDRADGKN